MPQKSQDQRVAEFVDALANIWIGVDPSFKIKGSFTEIHADILSRLQKTRFGQRMVLELGDQETPVTFLELFIKTPGKTHLIALLNQTLGFDVPIFFFGGSIPDSRGGNKRTLISLPSILTLQFTRSDENCGGAELPQEFDAGAFKKSANLFL